MSDESKNEAGMPDEKGDGPFLFLGTTKSTQLEILIRVLYCKSSVFCVFY